MPWRCPYCGYSCRLLGGMVIHLKHRHGVDFPRAKTRRDVAKKFNHSPRVVDWLLKRGIDITKPLEAVK